MQRPAPQAGLDASDSKAAAAAPEDQVLIDRLRRMMSARDAGGTQRRDVHCKMHGLMRAEFTVAADLPAELRHGVFAQPGVYKAWVRFSNAANVVKPDIARDIRGMAIKLMGVPGPKLLQAERDATTQDFILISAARFPTRTAGEFDGLVAAIIGNLWAKLSYFLTHPRVAWILLTTMLRHANVLQVAYFSAVAYALGPYVVKYVATPRVKLAEHSQSAPTDNFLRQRAALQLAQGDAVFDFSVQLQRDEACMPMDDPRVTWSLELSPPRKVASLRILQQQFDTEAIDQYAEVLAYTPWHSLQAHQPMGSINASRKLIYEALSAFRHQANKSRPREPSDWEV